MARAGPRRATAPETGRTSPSPAARRPTASSSSCSWRRRTTRSGSCAPGSPRSATAGPTTPTAGSLQVGGLARHPLELRLLEVPRSRSCSRVGSRRSRSTGSSPSTRTRVIRADGPTETVGPAAPGHAARSGAGAVSATLNGPNGPVATCVLTSANTSGLASQLLAGDNAVIVMPRDSTAANGDYSGHRHHVVAARCPGRSGSTPTLRNARWSPLPDTPPTAPASRFTAADPDPVGRLRVGAGFPSRLPPVRPSASRSRGGRGAGRGQPPSLNVTAVSPVGDGYLTMYPCTASVPDVSTVNFGAARWSQPCRRPARRRSGGLCVFSSVDTDVLVDVFGSLQPGGAAGYRPLTPVRLADTRSGGSGRQGAGSTLRLAVRGRQWRRARRHRGRPERDGGPARRDGLRDRPIRASTRPADGLEPEPRRPARTGRTW